MKEKPQQPATAAPLQPAWTRFILLAVLAYEGAGSLLGGILLIATPDGSSMEMPVSIMNGAFKDFMVPGLLLFGLGLLNTYAFAAVLRRSSSDWSSALVALGGHFIWFVTEIIILGQLHWLHAMWALPVLLGLIALLPLVASRRDSPSMRRALLSCGILSSVWYLAVNITVPLLDADYDFAAMSVSELSARGAITRTIWVLLCVPYPLLLAAFGWGIRRYFAGRRALRAAGTVTILYALLNLYWPPMHQRAVIAADRGGVADLLHILWAAVAVALMVLLMVLGAAGLKRAFRIFTAVIIAVFAVAGTLTAIMSSNIPAGLPTPGLGIWERINIAAFMLWVIVFALLLARKHTAGAGD